MHYEDTNKSYDKKSLAKSAAALPTLRRNLLGNLGRSEKTEKPNPSEAACWLYTDPKMNRNVNYLNLFMSETPRGKPRGILAQLDLKLRRPLRCISMMLDIFFNHLTSHTVSDRSCKIPIFPYLSRPKLPLQIRKLAEQLPRSYTLNDSYHVPYGMSWRKG